MRETWERATIEGDSRDRDQRKRNIRETGTSRETLERDSHPNGDNRRKLDRETQRGRGTREKQTYREIH